MENKKFEMTSETVCVHEKTLHRIKALIDFGDVKSGDLGGFIEKEENLSHDGDAWVGGNAYVYGDAQVYGNARVSGNARIYDNARISGNARICDNAQVCSDAWVCGDAWVRNDAWVCDDAWVSGNAEVCGYAEVCGNAWVCGDAQVSGNADYTTIKGFGTVFRTTTFFRCKDKRICVSCGCFYGTINQFREQVKRTRKGKIVKEYLMIADLMEMHIGKEVQIFYNQCLLTN